MEVEFELNPFLDLREPWEVGSLVVNLCWRLLYLSIDNDIVILGREHLLRLMVWQLVDVGVPGLASRGAAEVLGFVQLLLPLEGVSDQGFLLLNESLRLFNLLLVKYWMLGRRLPDEGLLRLRTLLL